MSLAELWVPVLGYEGYYEVSNLGKIRSIDRKVWTSANGGVYNNLKGKIKHFSVNKEHYSKVGFNKNGVETNFLVHRIVWEAFNGPIPEGYIIHHKNTELINGALDNSLSNLELMSRSDHDYMHSIDEETNHKKSICHKGKYNNKLMSKPVIQLTLDEEFVREWPSASEVERELGIWQGQVSACCRGEKKSYKNYIWKYKQESGATIDITPLPMVS